MEFHFSAAVIGSNIYFTLFSPSRLIVLFLIFSLVINIIIKIKENYIFNN